MRGAGQARSTTPAPGRSGTRSTRELSEIEVKKLVQSGKRARAELPPMPPETPEERADRERAEAMERIRAHRRQAANTRAMRPVGVASDLSAPTAGLPRVTLSEESLGMLDRQIERSVRPSAMASGDTPDADTEPPPPSSRRPARVTTRPVRHSGSTGARTSTDADRVAQLLQALRTVEALLDAGEVDAALAVIRDHKR